MRIDYFLEQLSSGKVEWFEHTNGGFVAEIPSGGVAHYRLYLWGSEQSPNGLTVFKGLKKTTIFEPALPQKLFRRDTPENRQKEKIRDLLQVLIHTASVQCMNRCTDEAKEREQDEVFSGLLRCLD